ncbi:YbjQ family protein [Candidatus Saccharibacteria bacterium]|nr:YbjQ family protein [Candidatus Saccharibacteria bacterium]MBR2695477.1 YbjQ family protein [Candidatus Saccharibacteria bacterium]
MLLVTTDTINGKKIEELCVVSGGTVQTVNLFRDFGSGLKNLVGGELKRYTEMMDDARKIATDRMIKSAEDVGADAIVGVRYASSSITQQASEVMVYGTAVKFI